MMDTDEAGPSTSAAAPPPPPQTLDTNGAAKGTSSESELYGYVVTAHRSSAVAQCVTAALTAPTDINLIISKVTRMEIHRLTETGLEGITDVAMYGRIACMRVRQ